MNKQNHQGRKTDFDRPQTTSKPVDQAKKPGQMQQSGEKTPQQQGDQQKK